MLPFEDCVRIASLFGTQLGIQSGCVENLLVYRPTTLHTYLLCKKLEWEGLVF